MKHPNILFILTDQQHSRMMSCAGTDWVRTPAMDSLAAAGTRFERAYCTNPVCVPSRFSLFTGFLPSEIGMWENGKPLLEASKDRFEAQGIGWRLRDAGYETLFGGKVHMPLGLHPDGLGFDYFCSDERAELAVETAALLRERGERQARGAGQPFCMVASLINPHDICYMAIRDFGEGDAMSERIIAGGVKELKALDHALKLPKGMDEETFFAAVCPPLPTNLEPQDEEPEAIRRLLDRRQFRRRAREQYTERDWRRHRWAYKNLTERVDREIGVILEALRGAGLEEDTVVIFSSDHGDHNGSHRMEHKDAHYEEASCIPLIVSQKGKTAAGLVDRESMISNGLDLIPTLCDYAGIEVPPGLKGASFRPLAEGREVPDWRKTVSGESQVGRYVVSGLYKYVRCFGGENAEQLYDLSRDPGETRNFLHDPACVRVLEQLRADFDVLHAASTQAGCVPTSV